MTLPLGEFGAYVSSPAAATAELACGLERAGYRALWVGGNPGGELEPIERAIAASTRLVVATGVVNIWKDEAEPIAACWHRIEQRFPGRLLLGVGVGHRETDRRRYAAPYQALGDYLNRLTNCGVPADAVVVGALGPRALRLAASRTRGAHPYLTTPEHTRRARAILGDRPLLAPVHKVVLTGDPETGRRIGRRSVLQPYLLLDNLTNNLRRLGYTDQDLFGQASDRLIDDLVIHGDPDQIVAGLRAHLRSGADHVAVELLTEGSDNPLDGYQRLADWLGLVPTHHGIRR